MTTPILVEFYREEVKSNDFAAVQIVGATKKRGKMVGGVAVFPTLRKRVVLDATRIVGVYESTTVEGLLEIRMTAGGSLFVNNPIDEVLTAWASATSAQQMVMTARDEDKPGESDNGSPDETPPPEGAEPPDFDALEEPS